MLMEQNKMNLANFHYNYLNLETFFSEFVFLNEKWSILGLIFDTNCTNDTKTWYNDIRLICAIRVKQKKE